MFLGKLTSMTKKLITGLTKKTFLNMSFLKVHSVKARCCHPVDFVIDVSIDIFCMSETWLYDNDSVIISDLTPEYHFHTTFLVPVKKMVELVA